MTLFFWTFPSPDLIFQTVVLPVGKCRAVSMSMPGASVEFIVLVKRFIWRRWRVIRKPMPSMDLPLTFIFTRPDGEEYQRLVDKGTSLGGYTVQLALTENAMRGTWQVGVHVDPKAAPITELRFLVEDFTPERTDFSLSPNREMLEIGKPMGVAVEGRYLYGAPAAGTGARRGGRIAHHKGKRRV